MKDMKLIKKGKGSIIFEYKDSLDLSKIIFNILDLEADSIMIGEEESLPASQLYYHYEPLEELRDSISENIHLLLVPPGTQEYIQNIIDEFAEMGSFEQ